MHLATVVDGHRRQVAVAGSIAAAEMGEEASSAVHSLAGWDASEDAASTGPAWWRQREV